MSDEDIREDRPSWQKARYGESETLRIGFLTININRPIGTRGGLRPKLYIDVGDIRLKREFDDWEAAREWALRTAAQWLRDASDKAQKLKSQEP